MSSRQLDEEAIVRVASKIDDPHARAEYLDQVCGGDSALRERVVALLEGMRLADRAGAPAR